MDSIMAGFANLKAKGISPDAEQVRLQVEKLRHFITDRMYL